MIGNPYSTRSVRWGDMIFRTPSTAPQIGKTVSNPGASEKWFVGIKLEAENGIARDMYNRAGVVTTEGVDSRIFNAMDLLPPDSFVNINLKNPSDESREGLAYDFRAIGENEYRWELNLSTSITSIPVRLSLDNLANIPEGVQLTLRDMTDGKTIDVKTDCALTLTLNKGNTHKYLLTAHMGPGSVTGADELHPVSFGFKGINPNPFNPSTTITFGVEKSGNVKLRIYNINGQLVETLTDGVMASGKHSILWNAKRCSSGVYLVVLEAGGKRDSKKISLVK